MFALSLTITVYSPSSNGAVEGFKFEPFVYFLPFIVTSYTSSAPQLHGFDEPEHVTEAQLIVNAGYVPLVHDK